MKLHTHLKKSIFTIALTLSLGLPAYTQTNGTWITNSGGNWNDSVNWTGGNIANGTDAVADISTMNITANSTLNQNLTGLKVGTLKMGDTPASHSWTISGSAIDLSVTTGVPVIQVVNTTQAVSMSSVLTGNQGLNKTGAGTLQLSGTNANTFTGNVTVSAGTLLLNKSNAANNAIVDGSATITVNTGSNLYWNFNNQVNDSAKIDLNGGKLSLNGKTETLGTLTLSGNSIIDFGAGITNFVFGISNATTWTGTLSLYNFTAGTDLMNFSSVNGLTAAQLASFQIYSDAGTTLISTGASLDASGYIVAAVPEPTTDLIFAILGLALLGITRKKLTSKNPVSI